VAAVVAEMQKAGIKSLGYIGFSDAWGGESGSYGALTKTTSPIGIKILTDEQLPYARPEYVGHRANPQDHARPNPMPVIDRRRSAVNKPAALPFLALRERAVLLPRARSYGTHAI